MRVMTILGSPRLEGNTAHLLDAVEEALRSNSHQVDRANMVDHHINGCRECYACQGGRLRFCAQDDDAISLFERMVAADAIVFAAPVFCWGFPAQLKGLIDRMFCLADEFHDDPEYSTRLQEKKMGLLATCGGPAAGNGEIMVHAFENLAQFMKTDLVETLLLDNCSGLDSIDDGARARARAFAAGLA